MPGKEGGRIQVDDAILELIHDRVAQSQAQFCTFCALKVFEESWNQFTKSDIKGKLSISSGYDESRVVEGVMRMEGGEIRRKKQLDSVPFVCERLARKEAHRLGLFSLLVTSFHARGQWVFSRDPKG